MPDDDSRQSEELPQEFFQPKVLEDYLAGEFSAIDELLVQLNALDDKGDFKNSLYQYLRRRWHLGRTAEELKRIVAAKPKLAAYKVADTMCVSATAVSGWQSGSNGITVENMEVLRRYYRERIEATSQLEFLLDLAGYVRLIEHMAKEPDDDIGSPLPMLQFWQLWHILRSPLWFEAFVLDKSHLKVLAVNEINELAFQQQLWYEKLQPPVEQNGTNRPTEPKAATEMELLRLLNRWGASFVVALAQLDYVCWTQPND